MTQPTPPDQWVALTFVADANTPPEVVQYDGKTFLMDPATMGAIGSGPTNPGKLLGVRGYRVVRPDGSAGWLMTSPVPPAVVVQFNALPGSNGWVDQSARSTYIQVGLMLLERYGAAAPDVLTALSSLYHAAVANDQAVPPGG